MNRAVDTEARLTGVLLAAGCAGYLVAVVIYLGIYGPPPGTGDGGEVTLADRVAHLQAHWPLARAMWLLETAAAIVLAIATLLMFGRSLARRHGEFTAAAWAVSLVGLLFLMPMYALMLGGYPVGIDAFDTTPALIEALNEIATFLFYVGSAVLFLGFGAALFAESRATAVLPRRVGFVGVVLGLAGFVGMAGPPLGVAGTRPLAVGGVIATALVGWLGVRLAASTGRLKPT